MSQEKVKNMNIYTLLALKSLQIVLLSKDWQHFEDFLLLIPMITDYNVIFFSCLVTK